MGERMRDMRAAGETLGLVSVLLDQHDWTWLADQLSAAEAVGPILDPTAFASSLADGTLARNVDVVRATRRYLQELHEIAGATP